MNPNIGTDITKDTLGNDPIHEISSVVSGVGSNGESLDSNAG